MHAMKDYFRFYVRLQTNLKLSRYFGQRGLLSFNIVINTGWGQEVPREVNLTLEQHWSLTQAQLLWLTSCPPTSAGLPQCSEAPHGWLPPQSWAVSPR